MGQDNGNGAQPDQVVGQLVINLHRSGNVSMGAGGVAVSSVRLPTGRQAFNRSAAYSMLEQAREILTIQAVELHKQSQSLITPVQLVPPQDIGRKT